MTSTRHLFRPMLALVLVTAALGGCARQGAVQPPRLLTPSELAALTAEAEGARPDEALAGRAAALRARATSLRATRGAGDDLRRRAAERSLAGG